MALTLKFLIIICFALFTGASFLSLRKGSQITGLAAYVVQLITLFAAFSAGFLSMYVAVGNRVSLGLFAGEAVYLLVMTAVFPNVITIVSPWIMLRLNKNMNCVMFMFIAVGMLVQERLNHAGAVKYFIFVLAATVLFVGLLYLRRYFNAAARLGWAYLAAGMLAALGAMVGTRVLGVSGIPAEIAEVFMVLFTAASFYKSDSVKNIVITAAAAIVQVVLLMLAFKQATAIIIFVVYVLMLYGATKKLRFIFGGLAAAAAAVFLGYLFISNIQTRIQVWLDPWKYAADRGYQVTQSLFAIGSGGAWGSGLFGGSPNYVPDISGEFVFSAIAEELGIVFSVCLILLCICLLIMMFTTTVRSKNAFARWSALGLSAAFGISVVLSVGACTGMLPSTGVGLPFICGGAGSIFASMMIMGIVQGIHSANTRAELGEEASLGIEETGARPRNVFAILVGNSLVIIAAAVFLVSFAGFKAGSVMDNSLNLRSDVSKNSVIRGKIYADDGTVLAVSEVDDEGNEVRSYPQEEFFAQAVGFAGYGGIGLEASYADVLANDDAEYVDGVRLGNSIQTTLNVKLQKKISRALDENAGAVIAMNPTDGSIVAMVSKPDFDPNKLDEIWDEINSSSEAALLNRTVQATYTPGSTFKIFTLLEYRRQVGDAINSYVYDCEGSITIGDDTILCHERTGHGIVTAPMSLAYSCNCSIVNMGMQLDFDTFAADSTSMLFGVDLPIDIDSKQSSVNMSDDMTDYMKMQTSFGQGETLVSPAHMAMYVSAVANKGVLMKPHLVSEVLDPSGNVVEQNAAAAAAQIMTEDEASYLRDCMAQTVAVGTATDLNSAKNYRAYGKTGTAETVNDDDDAHDHSWFVGWAEGNDGRKLVICVLIEDSQASGLTGVSVAKSILNYYYGE